MASRWTWSLTGGLSLFLNFGEFCKLLGATVSLSSGFHPQSSGYTEKAVQDLEQMLRCLASQNPSSWNQQLSWVEYAHNSLPVLATGLSPFECSLGYQPPLFPSMEYEVAIPSAHAIVQRCHRTWSRARQTLLQMGRAPRFRPIATGRSLPATSWVKNCVFLLRTFLSDRSVISLLPNVSAHLLSPN